MRNKSAIVIGSLSVASLLIGSLSAYGVHRNMESLNEPLNPEPIYKTVKPVNTPAVDFAVKVAENGPGGKKGWRVEGNHLNHHPRFLSCAPLDHPSTLLTTRRGTNKKIETVVQVYSAGYGLSAFEMYKDSLSGCNPGPVETVDGVKVLRFGDGILFQAGDALVFVSERSQKMVDHYVPLIRSSLRKTECVSLDDSAQVTSRSPYHDPKKYEGWVKRKKVKAEGPKVDVPKVTNVSSWGAPYIANEPEEPLPDDFPTLPQPVSVPRVSSIGKSGPLVATAVFQEYDALGPGCGWSWSGLTVPDEDKKKLDTERGEAVFNAQSEANRKANQAYSNYSSRFMEGLLALDDANGFLEYVAELKKVDKARRELNSARDAVWPEYEKYLSDLRAWVDEWNTYYRDFERWRKSVEDEQGDKNDNPDDPEQPDESDQTDNPDENDQPGESDQPDNPDESGDPGENDDNGQDDQSGQSVKKPEKPTTTEPREPQFDVLIPNSWKEMKKNIREDLRDGE